MIPQLGFGTLNVQPDRRPTPSNIAKTAEVVGQALEVGYRHIDTAQMYGTEQGVGEAIAASGIPREELYVTSKLGNGNHRPDDVRRSFGETLDNLHLDYLDLFLIHWPLPTRYDGDYVSTWRAMTELVADGRLRSAGVSSFQPDHLDRIISETGIAPVVNQIEVHRRPSRDSHSAPAHRRVPLVRLPRGPRRRQTVLRRPHSCQPRAPRDAHIQQPRRVPPLPPCIEAVALASFRNTRPANYSYA